MEDFVVPWKVLPGDTSGLDGDGLHVGHPVADESEESPTPLFHPLLPGVELEELTQLGFVLGEAFLRLDYFVEAVFPVEHHVVGSRTGLGIDALLGQVELRPSPFLNVGVSGMSDCCQDLISELGDGEVGVGTEELGKLPLLLVVEVLQRLKSGVEKGDHQPVVLDCHFDLVF